MPSRAIILVLALASVAVAQSRHDRVEGLVVDTLGEPIPAVSIEAWANGKRLSRSATDGEGIYQLARLPDTVAELRFAAHGKAAETVMWRGLTSPNVRCVVLEDACRLLGNVADESGTRIADAAVILVAGRQAYETRSDVHGEFTFDAVPLRRCVLRAWSNDGWGERELRLLGDAKCELTIERHGGATHLVRVEGLPADALATAALQVFSGDLGLLPNRGRVSLRADATAELLLKESSLIELQALGFTATPSTYHVQFSSSTLIFHAAPTSADELTPIHGRVRTASNRPISGLRLMVRDRSNRDLGTAVLNADGDWRIKVPMPVDGFCRFGLEQRDWCLVDDERSFADGFSWVPGSVSTTISIQLVAEPATSLLSTLRTTEGGQFVFAEITAADVEHADHTFCSATSDRTGKLSMALPPGGYELLAVTLDGRVAGATAHMGDGEQPVATTWKTVPSGEIRGRLCDAKGHPIPGVDLFVASTALQDRGEARVTERRSCTVVTDRLGRYRARGLPAGPWTVVGLRGDVVETTAEVVANHATTADLQAR